MIAFCTFAGALFGVFLVSSLLRLAAVLVWMPRLPQVRAGRRASVQRAVFRFTRYSAISGVVCDVVSLVRPKRKPGAAS